MATYLLARSKKKRDASMRQAVFLLGLLLIGGAHAGTVYYDYTDPEGNVLAVADAQSNVLARYDYAPYGAPVASLGSPPDGPGYTGHVNDPETGLVYMQARYYLPVGRFPSPDSASPEPGNVFKFNRYAYANNNPATNIDPDGRQALPPSAYTIDWTKSETRQAFTSYAASMIPGYGIYNCATSGCGKAGWAMAVASTGLTVVAAVSNFAGPLRGMSEASSEATSRLVTPIDDAIQPAAEEATFAIEAPYTGQTIYRVYGGDSAAGGASWSPINPLEVSNFRDAAGLPSGGASGFNNTGRFVITGTLEDPSAAVLTRPALPLDGNMGGLPEYVIPNWSNSGAITVRNVGGANPEF